MTQVFIRCSDCGMPHDALHAYCPTTGQAAPWIQRRGISCDPQTRAPPRPPPLRDLIGKTIGGKYAIRRILGGGGMGTVFEGEHTTIGRLVAIKVLHPMHAQKKETVLRFQREARTAARIAHPNVCEVYDLGALDDGRPYLVMEKLDGETLGRRIATAGALPLHEVVDILGDVLAALSAAHGAGIIHRDIKPDNIFLAGRPGHPLRAKLLDFGVAKILRASLKEDDVDLTCRGMVMGTPHYMSPEQARGDRNLDARADLYACGVVLYEAMTGRRPFVASDHGSVLHAILRGKPRPVRELRRGVPSAFEAVVAKAMARNRSDRFASAVEFQRALRSLRDRAPSAPGVAKALAPRLPPPLPRSPPGDEHPTRVWVRRPGASPEPDTVVFRGGREELLARARAGQVEHP